MRWLALPVVLSLAFLSGCEKKEVEKRLPALTASAITGEAVWNRIENEANWDSYGHWPGLDGLLPGQSPHGKFHEIYVNAPLEVCERRDPKGLYAKSRAGRLPNFTGVDSPYEAPEHPDLVLDSASASAEALAERVIALLQSRAIVTGDSGKRG